VTAGAAPTERAGIERWREYVFALAPLTAAMLWGGMYVVSKWGFETIPPLTLGFARVSVGAVALLAIVRYRYPDRTFSRRDAARFFALACWVTGTTAAGFVGTDLTSASQGALLTVVTPVFTVVLGVAVLGEAITRRRIVGIALATAGTVVVAVGEHASSVAGVDGWGVLALLAAALTWAAYTVWGKPLVRRYSALETAAYSTVLSVPLCGLLAAAELTALGISPTELPRTLSTIGAVLYLGVAATAVAWYLWYKGIEYVDTGTVAVFIFLQPVVGTALGAAFLGEQIGTAFVAGGVVMSYGVYLVSKDRGT